MDQTTIHVPPELFAAAESSSFAGTFAIDKLDSGPDIYVFDKPASWSVVVTNTGGALLVAGTVSGVATTECGRCLDPVDVAFNGEVEGYYLLNPEEADFEEGEDEEFDVLGPDDTIDLVPLLQAAILIDMPVVPLCQPDCKGLCQTCGANLNRETCDCAAVREADNAAFEAAKNPFAKLRELDLGTAVPDAPVASAVPDAPATPEPGEPAAPVDSTHGKPAGEPTDSMNE